MDNKSIGEDADYIQEGIGFPIQEKSCNINDLIVGSQKLRNAQDEEYDEIEAGLIDILDDNAEDNDQTNPLLETEMDQAANPENLCTILAKKQHKNCGKRLKMKKKTTSEDEDQPEHPEEQIEETEKHKERFILAKSKNLKSDFFINAVKLISDEEILPNEANYEDQENEVNVKTCLENIQEIQPSSIQCVENGKDSIEDKQASEINTCTISNQNNRSNIVADKSNFTKENEENEEIASMPVAQQKIVAKLNENLENLENSPTKLETKRHGCSSMTRTKRLRRNPIGKNNVGQNNCKVREKTVKGKTLLIENESLIKKHLLMLCDLCPYTASDFIELTQHFKEHHAGIKSYIKCCTRKLNCASDIIQHAHLHEDPNYFR